MKYIETKEVRGTGVVIIDADSGKVVGTNLRMCYVPMTLIEDVLHSEHAARYHADTYGIPVFVEQGLDD